MCPVCGFPVDAAGPLDNASASSALAIESGIPVRRVCPSCGNTYGADYADPFCACGFELVATTPNMVAAPAASPPTPERPPAGTPCLVLYGPDKRPLRYFALTRDVTLIGRLDAVAGNFPEVDLGNCLEADTARKVSRKHALILRNRVNHSYTLRPLAGNTGTQVEADMVPPLQDVALEPGHRMIFGGAARFKFEIA
jgi:hypothetical protein